jgi:hypothetical protein
VTATNSQLCGSPSLFSEVSVVPVYYPKAGSVWLAGITQTALANSKLRLFQDSLVTNLNTTRAQLVAAEADYSGYVAATMVAFGDPYAPAIGGAAINSPEEQFMPTDPVTIPNNIGGAWIETAGGDLVVIDQFPESIAISEPTDAIPLLEILRFLSGL